MGEDVAVSSPVDGQTFVVRGIFILYKRQSQWTGPAPKVFASSWGKAKAATSWACSSAQFSHMAVEPPCLFPSSAVVVVPFPFPFPVAVKLSLQKL